MKKTVNIKLKLILTVFTFGLLIGGCEEYLDQAPEANIDSKEVFKDFRSFQGFVEECYNNIVDVSKIELAFDFNLADETRYNSSTYLSNSWDAGNYWAWQSGYASYFKLNGTMPPNPMTHKGRGTWVNSWYGIRVANNGLANLDKLVGTQEEKDIIKGQLLFFRGYFYFTLMRDWGGLPYIKKLLTAIDEMKYPRLSYQETAMMADADFAEAASLLPLNWDDTQTGQRTLGKNVQRLNKVMALSFQGKNLLYAASPLMNKESKGIAAYDAELCKKAADVFAQVINTCEQTGRYSLQPWDTYSNIFYVVSPNHVIPGGTEAIFISPYYDYGETWGLYLWGPSSIGQIGRCSVCANYVNNWGMKNGLPISDPASGYNPADPWINRDPRFYKTIVVDGDKICNATSAGVDQFAQLYNNGRHRGAGSNITGFMSNKYWGLTCNKFDNELNGSKFKMSSPILRLSDVYLMYAEAVVNGYGTPQSSVPGCYTAEAAVNKVRNRATVPDLDPKFTGSKDAFMEQLVVERAVELSFEGLRWNDLRRWLKNSDPKYLNKTELLFDREPATKKPINIQERLIVKRLVDEKHNWLPLPVNQVTLYKDFKQNPGW